ncbi:hypothetical protein ACJOWW_14820, partial [Acinetobacter baumannii]|nr:hypothetical protein [Acinetobacter baumannii]
ATIFTAGAALSVIAPGMSLFAGGLSVLAGTSSLGIAGSMAVAAGAAAVGSAASQLVGKAMGVVDSFSWSQVGISALTAAATAGVGGALAPAAGAAGTTGATATQSSWASAAKTAINNGGWVAKGAVYGAVSYGSTYLANQVFGNNQSFSWASLGSSIVGSIAAAGIGAKGLLDGLGTTVSPYAYSLAGANAAAVIDDKWFGGAKPDYLNVSMAAIANAGVRQFGESSSSSQYKSNITVYNPATGERTALENTPSLYAYSGGEFIDDLRNFNWSGIRDGIREEFFDYKPNNSRESSIALVNGANSDVTQLPTIKVKATDSIVYALGGVNSTYNMTAALGRVEERARLQREIDISNANNRRTWQEWADEASYSGSFIDAAKYVSRQTYLKVANFTTFGLYSRSDERLLQVRQGKLSPSLARRADLIESGTGAVVTLASAGTFNILRSTASVGLAGVGFGRTAQYYGGSAIAGAGSGAFMDTGIQSAERINYDISGGITGRSEYDLGQITLSSVVGGVASPLLGAIPAFANSKYNVDLQWPIDFDVSAGQLNSGIPLRVRTPIKSLDIDNISIPSVRNGEFANWFNNISSDEFQQIWSVGKFQNQIKTRLRSPGGLHEWHLVSRADVFKNWGVKAEQIAELRTAISDVKFVNPKGIHGGKGSTIAHNELLDIIDTSLNYDTFVRRLQNWSNYRLDGGVSSLPQGLQPK